MKNASFFAQTHVYFKKITRISIREKAWIFLAFACIIALIVNFVTASDMFKNLDNTKSGFFTMASAVSYSSSGIRRMNGARWRTW